MSAYILPIHRPKCPCGKRATHSVFNSTNSCIGVRCAPCARRDLKTLQAAEAKGSTDPAPRPK